MADSTLYELYRLHLIDRVLEEDRARYTALDAGKSILKQIADYKAKYQSEIEAGPTLQREIKDLELRVGGMRDRLKQVDKELYSGKVVNPREIAAYEQEIEHLKQRIADAETEELEKMEGTTAADALSQRHNQVLADATKKYQTKKAHDLRLGEEIQTRYKSKAAERAAQAKLVSAPLLAQYEAVRKKQGGIGMGIVEKGACGACGTNLPTKVIESLDKDRLVTCESCHRILFKVVPGS